MAEELAKSIVLASKKLEKKDKIKQIVPLYVYSERIEYRNSTATDNTFELDTLRTSYKFGDENTKYDNLSTILAYITSQGYSIVCDDKYNLELKFLGLVGKETIARTSHKRHYVDMTIAALYEK